MAGRIGLVARNAVALAALALAAAGGCTKKPATPLLSVAINSGVEGEALKAAAREWGKDQNVEVQIIELPYANLFEKALLDLRSRTGAYDVVMLDDPWFPAFVRDGQLTELDPLYRKAGLRGPDADFVQSCLDVSRQPWAKGAYFALPYVGNSQVFFYRKDLFDRHKLPEPKKWSDVLAAARKLGAAEKMHGYVMRAAPGNAVVADFMPLMWAFGGELLDEQGRPAVDSPEVIQALKFMVELGRHAPPGYTGYNADEVSAHLLQSTAAMSINWPAWIGAMDDPAKSKVSGKVAFAEMPGEKRKGQPELGTWLLAIPAGSQRAELAFQFIRWATDPQQMKVAALRGNPPTRRSLFRDPELVRKFRAYPVQLASLERAKPRPRTHLWNEIENAFGIYLSKANSGSLSPEQAMKRANEEIRDILERNGAQPSQQQAGTRAGE